MVDDCGTLGELERRAEQGLYRDYQQAGEALRAIRDGGLYRATHRGFGAYVEERFGCARSTAYALIQAAEVAADLSARSDTVRVPARHAQLLFPFPSDVRLALANVIGPLTVREAQALVLTLVSGDATARRQPRHERDLVRRARAVARRVCELRVERVAAAIAALDDDGEREQLRADLRRAADVLDALGADDATRAERRRDAIRQLGE